MLKNFCWDWSLEFGGGSGRGSAGVPDAWLWEDGVEILWEDGFYIQLES